MQNVFRMPNTYNLEILVKLITLFILKRLLKVLLIYSESNFRKIVQIKCMLTAIQYMMSKLMVLIGSC